MPNCYCLIWMILNIINIGIGIGSKFVAAENKVIKLHMYYNQGLDSLYIKGGIGTPLQEIYFALDTHISFSFILQMNENYIKNSSSTYINTTNFRNESILLQGYEFQETIYLESITLPSYSLIEIKKHLSFIFVPYIGIGKGSGSFIYQLYQRKMINRQVFQFFDRILIIGTVQSPNPFQKYHSKCTMVSDVNDYACKLIGIIFTIGKEANERVVLSAHKTNIIDFDSNYNKHDNQLTIDRNIIFSTRKNNIVFPIEFIDAFEQMFFNKMHGKPCTMLKENTGTVLFNCNITNELQKEEEGNLYINLLFERFIMRLEINDLLYKNNFYSTYKTVSIQFSPHFTDVIFGFNFLTKFYVGISQEDNSIKLFSDNNLFDVSYKNTIEIIPISSLKYHRELIKALIMICLGIVSIGMIVGIINMMKHHNTIKPI